MANLSKQELVNLNNSLISVDPDTGEKIASMDHRFMNMAMVDFICSHLPINVYVNGDGKLVDDRMEIRTVAFVTVNNSPLQKTEFQKPYNSNTLTFVNGNSFSSGTIVTVTFEQP